MRVLYINHTLRPSGAGISLATLIRHLPSEVTPGMLVRRRFEAWDLFPIPRAQIHVSSWMCHFQTTVYGPPYGPLLKTWHAFKKFPAAREFHHLVQTERPDIVHLNETTLWPYAWFAHERNIPVVMHVRTAIRADAGIHRQLEALNHIPRLQFVAIDPEMEQSLPPSLHPRARVLYNPIQIPPPTSHEERTQMRSTWGFSSEHVVIGSVGTLHKEKGVFEFLDMAAQLHASKPHARFVFVGDDAPAAGEGPALKQRARELGLKSVVHFAGYHSNPHPAMAALDIVTILSGPGMHGIGRPAFEAGFVKRPAVVTWYDSETETLMKGGIATIVPPGNKNALLQALVTLVDSPDLRAQRGSQACEQLKARHDPAFYAAEMCRIYRNL